MNLVTAGRTLLAALALSSAACHRTAPPTPPPEATRAAPAAALYDPAHDLGPLFHDVQMAGLFPDSKTFVDARPLAPPANIARGYAAERGQPGFDLRAFVDQHFEPPRPAGQGAPIDTSGSMEQHILRLWPALTRRPSMNSRA